MVLRRSPYLTPLMREKKASSKTPKLKSAISDPFRCRNNILINNSAPNCSLLWLKARGVDKISRRDR